MVKKVNLKSLDAWAADKSSSNGTASKKVTIENMVIENISESEKIPIPMLTEKHQNNSKKVVLMNHLNKV